MSFAFARRAPRDERLGEYRYLLHALFEHPKTRGVGYNVLALGGLTAAHAKGALVASVGWLASAAEKWNAAERARLTRESAGAFGAAAARARAATPR